MSNLTQRTRNMRNGLLLYCLLCTYTLSLHAQEQYDAKWVLGAVNTHVEEVSGTLLNFTADGPSMQSIDKELDMYAANSSLSDEQGNLLFYSNGCGIHNADHQEMETGYSTNPNLPSLGWCNLSGSPFQQSMISLPWPGRPNYYAFIHQSDYSYVNFDAPGESSTAAHTLAMTKIDMRLNNRLGFMIEKKRPILQDTLAHGYLQAVKHANGRDWWILVPELKTNCYHRFLFTRYGIIENEKQCIGETPSAIAYAGQCVFSPDGAKYVRYDPLSGIYVYNFNRCEGLLSTAILVSEHDSTSFTYGAAISPNSRFLYTAKNRVAFQYDLEADDIAASKIQIAEYDGFADPNPVYFGFLQLAPDNKIYGTGFHYSPYLHVIHQPDSEGLDCQFEQRGLNLLTNNSASLPNFAHFRLGTSTEICRQPPQLILDAELPCADESFGVSLISQYLDKTVKLSFEIQWDASVIAFDTAWQVIALDGLYIDTQNTSEGKLSVHWQDDSGEGLSFLDYTHLLQLQFEAISNDNKDIGLLFSDAIDIQQLHSGQALSEEIVLIAPTLSISKMEVMDQTVVNVINGDDGAIAIAIEGGHPPYTYNWSNGATTKDNSALSAGEYFCTITDYAGCFLEIGPIEVETVVGISEQLGLTDIHLYPNPSQGNFLLTFPKAGSGLIQVWDMNGLLWLNQSFQQQEKIQIETELPKGLYMLTVKQDNSTATIKMAVVK